MVIFSVLLLMVWMHIMDDFVLQPICLSKLKCRETWKKYDNTLYKNDYKMALTTHSLSWSISIHIPIMVVLIYYYPDSFIYGITWAIIILWQAFLHYIVDDAKANKKKTSLVTDQSFHLFQVFVSWITFLLFLPKNWLNFSIP